MTTLLVTHDDCLHHVTPPGHPEQVARLEAVRTALADPAFDALLREEAPLATDAQIRLAHPQSHLDRIRAAVPSHGFAQLDADTHLSPGSLQAALRAAGGIVRAVDAVLDGEARNAFCATRPPGHHAERETAMGFCLFGTVVIGARHALERGLSRVAIVDFDVHHGNGTQDLVWNDARIFFASSHQSPLYPGTGLAHERGAHDNVLNVPLLPGTDGAGFRQAWETFVLPALEAAAPEMILVSAGFDAHRDDPLANLRLTERDFAWVTNAICDVADRHAAGRVVSTLEGGYDLHALAASAATHVETLMERGE
ncbi:histone deacetylase family protein [Halovulum dunhuangense]|uniref:Histone deacetylase family protein n=1 Tax=Halovulum dunhuangense TaxID=1505036 RepID=A0A849KZM1_9RHOB|nr:histone deacetylase family protein [Halovulum dunhuangense]NNU79304.1 histone deacetylase family protein [Halovulum dunhuangense]